MSERAVVFIAVGVAIAIGAVVLAFVGKRSSGMREMLRAVAAAAGWMEIDNLRMRAGVRGRWRSFTATLSYLARQKSTPQRLALDLRAYSDVRLSVRRRFAGMFSNKPLTWFGPPLVEVHAPAASAFWVRADEVNLAERIFADEAVAAAIANAIVARFDELKVNAKGLHLVRALDETAVREKYGWPRFTMRFEPAQFEPLAREQWNAAEAVVNKLSMM